MHLASTQVESASPLPPATVDSEPGLGGGAAEAPRASAAWARSVLEAAHDAICVTDATQALIDCNERFLRMWGIDAAALARGDRAVLREIVRRRVADPVRFYARLAEILRADQPETHDVIELRDGRLIERHSRVRNVDGRPVGRVWTFRDITEHRRAEEALQRNEAELRALADSMAQLAWMAEPDGHIFWYNRRWYEYTGTTLEDMRGWGWQAVHEPSMVAQVVRRWSRAIEAGAVFEMEFPLRGADGRYRWFLTRAIPVRDAAGRVRRWFGTNTDVDRAKRAEDALREETRVLELLNRTGTAIAAQLDLAGLLRTVTDAGTELSGARFGAFFQAEADGGGEPRFVLRARAGEGPETPLAAPGAGGDFPGAIFRAREARRRDDAPGEVAAAGLPAARSYLAVPVVSRSGEVLGGLFFGHPEPAAFDARTERVITGVAAQAAIALDNARLYESAQRDIAARAATERRLREGEARLRVALDTAALGVWELDARSGETELDERCLELFAPGGRRRMAFEDFVALAHPDQRAARREALRRLRSGEAERYEMEFRVDGAERWLRAGAKPVRDGAGRITRLIGGVLDVTDLVRARATTEERQRELERLVEERTASLHAAIAQMEEFSYSVSHDLRAPLRAIQGYAQAVMEDHGDKLDARGRELLARVVAAGRRMDRLTLDVLTYSRIARGAAPLSVVSLERLVDDVVEQYAPEDARPGHVRVERPLLEARGHEPLLAQAVSNLLANALKFVAKGVTPEVRVRTERRGDRVRLWVEDNGIGLRPEHCGRIWGMFERIHPQEKYEGTGIGLAIVRKAVERMGGSVGVESEPGKGSRFWIELAGA